MPRSDSDIGHRNWRPNVKGGKNTDVAVIGLKLNSSDILIEIKLSKKLYIRDEVTISKRST